jgi:hypothetical protein
MTRLGIEAIPMKATELALARPGLFLGALEQYPGAAGRVVEADCFPAEASEFGEFGFNTRGQLFAGMDEEFVFPGGAVLFSDSADADDGRGGKEGSENEAFDLDLIFHMHLLSSFAMSVI